MSSNTLLPHNYDSNEHNLKNCPFCGCIPVWHLKGNEHTPSRTIVIKCPECGVEMKMSGRAFGVQPLALHITEKWNKRV